MNLVWLTRDRPQTLLRSVRSCLAALRGKPSELTLHAVHSGSAMATTVANLYSFGPYERYVFVCRLEEACAGHGIHPDVVRFALGPPAAASRRLCDTGANRNLLLLLNAGKKFLSCDDDVLFECARWQNTMDLSGGVRDPYGMQFFDSEASARDAFSAQAPFSIPDFLSAHAKALGTAHSDGRIAITTTGIWGDSGVDGMRSFFLLRPDLFARLCKTPDRLHQALHSRWVWRQTENLFLALRAPFSAAFCGYDNTLPLPPFFPFGRGQDAAYPLALNGCAPGLWTAHLPGAIRHAPQAGVSPPNAGPPSPRINSILSVWWEHYLQETAQERRGYATASRYFRTLAEGGAFRERYEATLIETLQTRVKALEKNYGQVEAGNGPAYDLWRATLLQELDQCGAMARSAELRLPEESQRVAFDQDGLHLVRSWVALYADLLEAWPAIRHEAGELVR